MKPGKIQVRLGTGEDWDDLRNCFLRAFQSYPLYRHLLPKDDVRKTFLRRYLDANYEACRRLRTGILLCIEMIDTERDKPPMIIGGALFGKLAQTENEAKIQNAHFDEMYQNFNLREIDPDAYERLIKYEAWEEKHVDEKLRKIGPIWNGLFSAVEPQYIGKGIGTSSFAEMAKVLGKRVSEIEQKSNVAKLRLNENRHDEEIYTALNYDLKTAIGCDVFYNMENQVKETSMSAWDICYKFGKEIIKGLSLFSRNQYHYALLDEPFQQLSSFNINNNSNCIEMKPVKPKHTPGGKCDKESPNTTDVIKVMAITHCPLTSKFYKRNGLREILNTKYRELNDVDLFDVTTLAMDISINEADDN